MGKEKFNAVKALTAKSTQEQSSTRELLYKLLEPSNDREFRASLDNYFSIKISDAHDETYFKNFLEINNGLINSEIKSNKFLTASISELSRVYAVENKFYTHALEATEYFIKNLVELSLTTEYNYLTRLKDMYMIGYDPVEDTKRKIVGELLSFDLRKGNFSINSNNLSILLSNIGAIVIVFSKLLSLKEKEGTEAVIQAIALINKQKAETQQIKPKLSEQDRFIENIRKAKNRIIATRGKASIRAVASELKIPDSTFRDRLKEIMIHKEITWGAI